MITIVDYGLGNLFSIQNIIKKVGGTATISADPEEISRAKKIILPGVGAFDEGIANIDRLGLRTVLQERAAAGIPMLGICLGMQLMLDASEEGSLPGLGLVGGRVSRFPSDVAGAKLRIPHVGWNEVKASGANALLADFEAQSRFYFIHSFYANLENAADEMLQTSYGINFSSGFARGNVRGVQFHPERSHRFGKQLFKNFVFNC